MLDLLSSISSYKILNQLNVQMKLAKLQSLKILIELTWIQEKKFLVKSQTYLYHFLTSSAQTTVRTIFQISKIDKMANQALIPPLIFTLYFLTLICTGYQTSICFTSGNRYNLTLLGKMQDLPLIIKCRVLGGLKRL